MSCLYAKAAEGRLARTLRYAAATGRCEDQMSLIGKGAAPFCAEVIVSAVRDARHSLCGFACLIRDIAGRKRGQSDLPGTCEPPLEAPGLKYAFLSTISHEIRTPLNIILGYSDLIAENLAEMRNTSQKDYLEAVARACKRLLRTLDAMLDFSKLEAGQFPVDRRTVALVPLIQRLLSELEPLASQKGLELVFVFEEESAAVKVDEYCLINSLRNLIENAIKFTDRGSVTVRLNRGPGNAARISVSDTGIGVAAAYMPHLLEPFSQEDSGITRRFEGAGLGLALTQRYLELNSAGLIARSEKGVGSTFTIHFAGTDAFAPSRFELSHKAEARWTPATKR